MNNCEVVLKKQKIDCYLGLFLRYRGNRQTAVNNTAGEVQTKASHRNQQLLRQLHWIHDLIRDIDSSYDTVKSTKFFIYKIRCHKVLNYTRD